LVQVFAHNSRKRLAEIREAITMGEDKRLERVAHGLRGEVGLFGATMASNLAAQLETIGREGHLGSALHVLQGLEREVEQVILFVGTTPDGKHVHEAVDVVYPAKEVVS
jgi:two-component system sensor histidine kinase/response regulator